MRESSLGVLHRAPMLPCQHAQGVMTRSVVAYSCSTREFRKFICVLTGPKRVHTRLSNK